VAGDGDEACLTSVTTGGALDITSDTEIAVNYTRRNNTCVMPEIIMSPAMLVGTIRAR
jgi:hypothetical protein